MTTEHTADEAGGEAVFAYDGLPSLSLPPPPIGNTTNTSTTTNDDDEVGEAVIIEEQKFRTAFETFNESNTGWMGLCHPTKNHVIEVPGGGGSGSVGGTNVGWEDPRRKLYQLKVDIDNLERQFDNEAQLQYGNGGGEGPEEEELKAATIELKSRLTSLGLSDSTSLSNLLNGRQSDLSSVISNDVAKFNSGDGGIDADMDNLSLKGGERKEGDTGDESGVGGGKIVYELYRDAKSKSNVPREAMLEERLRKLELAMGSISTSSTSDGGNKSIMERIEAAERLTSEVDIKQIDKLASKAKVIRADLEAAARAKNKLSSKSSSNKDSQQKEDANVISALHTQLQELEGLSQHLPSLTNRLLELQTLHLNASNFSSRLDSAEESVSRCEGMLSNVESSLSNMENGWKSNMELIEKNVDRLDKLLTEKTSQS